MEGIGMTSVQSSFKPLIEIDIKEIVVNNQHIKESHIKQLLDKYKETVGTTIIQQFGLGPFFDNFKDGGNVTTLHNAENGVFANNQDAERYNQSFDRKNYEKDFPKKRKEKFKTSSEILDDYTGKNLAKDGTTHLDHVVSAKAIHDNNKARLYMDDEQRNVMATSDPNLAWTDSSLNQSKNDKDLNDWMDQRNRKNPDKTNAEYYEVDRSAASRRHSEANEHINKTIKKEEVKYYAKNVAATGVNQGLRMAKKQAIGMFLYEFQAAFMAEMKGYFNQYHAYDTFKRKLVEFKNVCYRVKERVLAKAKKILIAFGEGFIGGFVANLITILINTFATTTKNVARVLNDGFHALIKAFKVLIAPPENITKQEALLEVSKILSTAVVASFGVILTEAFATYLKTTPAAPFADLIAGVIGGILTGIVSVTLVYVIDNFNRILKDIGESFRLIQYQLTVSAKEIREIYTKAIADIDAEYQLILNRIFKEYEELNQLTAFAYNCGELAGVQFKHSQKLARANGLSDKEILLTDRDIDDFFLN